MGDRKQPIGKALDVFVYAPIGFLFSLPDLVPQLAEKGREQVRTAVVISQLAAGGAQQEAGKLARRFLDGRRRTSTLTGASGVAQRPPLSAVPYAAPAPAPGSPLRAVHDPEAADALAIPGYDALSASQVVPRLEGLTGQELEAVRVYEEARRGRKTVLNRIAQLQAAS